MTKILNVLGVLALVSGLTARGNAAEPPKHHDVTIWVNTPTGSHIGGGYTSTYLTNISPRTIGKEDPKLRSAIQSLDGLGMLQVKGFGLVPAAVAWQTQIPMRKLIQEQADTRLSYGELLMAHSLAAKSNQGFAQIIDMRVKSQTWGEVAKQLEVDPEFIITRAHTAANRIVAVDFRSRHRPSQGLSSSGPNPHTQRSHLY